MLTDKQKGLFKLLEITEDREADIRKFHKIMKDIGAPKDFTRWLNKCLQTKWREENRRIYVGD